MAKSGRRNKIGVFDVVNTIVMLFLIFITLYPFYHIVCASFSNSTLLSAHKGLLVRPLGFNIGAYKLTFKHPLIWSGYRNILIIMAVALPYQLFMTLLCGYFMSCKGMMFKKPIMALILFTMFFGGGLIPTYLVVKELRMLDTIWVLILPNAVTMYYVLLMLNFFRGLPSSIEEAAIVDGCNQWQTMVKIYLPLSLPSLATIALFIVVGHWNEWFDGMIYNNKSTNYPLMTFLQYQIINFKTSDLRPEQIAANPSLADLDGRAIKSAGIVLCTVPILCLYPFLQRYFVTGIVVGSVKG